MTDCDDGANAEPFVSWGLAPGAILVRAAANEVFRCLDPDGHVVYLRVTSAQHRDREQILAEIDWMRSLAAHGVRVVSPLPSRSGDHVRELTRHGQPALAVCFARAPGRQAEKARDYTPAVAESWGALLADLHRHARSYLPPGPARRPRWADDPVLRTALQATNEDSVLAQRRLREFVTWMESLPAGPEGFGLTHADLHVGNLSVADTGEVWAFDFDDACHHWFAHDLAVGLTSIRKAAWELPGHIDAPAIQARLLDSYARHGGLDQRWLDHVEDFVAYRIALSACWASRSFHTGQLDVDMTAWYRRSLPWWLEQLTTS